MIWFGEKSFSLICYILAFHLCLSGGYDFSPDAQLFNVFSSSCCLTQGLSQGFVVVLLFFLFCINYLASSLISDADIALFVDDFLILTTAFKRGCWMTASQSVIKYVFDWSQQMKLNLNTSKSKVFPFSTWSNNGIWQPALFIGNQKNSG